LRKIFAKQHSSPKNFQKFFCCGVFAAIKTFIFQLMAFLLLQQKKITLMLWESLRMRFRIEALNTFSGRICTF